MRRLVGPLTLSLVSLAGPTWAHATPWQLPSPGQQRAARPAGPGASLGLGWLVEPAADPEPVGAEPDPTPDAAEPAATEPAATEPAGPAEPAATEPTDRKAAKAAALAAGFSRHGVGVRSGLVVVPTWALSSYVLSHGNALCRADAGDWAAERGVTKVEGCNWYVQGEYTYRQSRVFDIVGAVGYQRLAAPDSYWLDKDEVDANGQPKVRAADYTEVDVSFVSLEADFIGRAPVVVTKDFELDIGGGAGVGIGILTGKGVWQTPMGPDNFQAQPECRTIADLSDFRRCTPQYFDDPDINQFPELDGQYPGNSDPPVPPDGANPVARCTKDKCNYADLDGFGSRRRNSKIPPVVPIINLIISVRMVVKDSLGITINGGWNWGFYFGGGVSYMFGKKA